MSLALGITLLAATGAVIGGYFVATMMLANKYEAAAIRNRKGE